MDKEVSVSYQDDLHCTGWGIIDGVMACIRGIKKRRQKKNKQKLNK